MVELFEVKALDFWSFGGLKNFQAGVDTYRKPVFPPDIMKFFHIVDLNKLIPVAVFLKKEDEIYLPVPADLLQPRKGEKGELKISPLIKKGKLPEGALTDLESFKVLPFIEKSEVKYEGAKGYLPFGKLKNYFTENRICGADTDNLKGLDCFVSFEPKVGLTLNFDTFSAEESRLYFTFAVRPKKDTSLVVVFKKKNDESVKIEEGIYHIGGETRVSKVQKVENEEFQNFLSEKINVCKGKLYKFYLLSHTYIDGKLEIEKTLLRVGNVDFELVWAFTKGKEWISGYKKPAVEMLLPSTVLVLKAKDDALTNRLNYIGAKTKLPIYEGKDEKKLKEEEVFLHDYGWNWGILIPTEV